MAEVLDPALQGVERLAECLDTRDAEARVLDSNVVDDDDSKYFHRA